MATPRIYTSLRLPAELHELIVELAEADRRSFNAEIIWLVEQGVSIRTGHPAGTLEQHPQG